MDAQKGIPVANRETHEIIEVLEHCCLCGHKLAFYHVTDFRNLQVVEEGQCPACGIKNKPGQFILQ